MSTLGPRCSDFFGLLLAVIAGIVSAYGLHDPARQLAIVGIALSGGAMFLSRILEGRRDAARVTELQHENDRRLREQTLKRYARETRLLANETYNLIRDRDKPLAEVQDDYIAKVRIPLWNLTEDLEALHVPLDLGDGDLLVTLRICDTPTREQIEDVAASLAAIAQILSESAP